MSLEIKTLNVNNSSESAIIALHQSFGWKFKSSQRIYSKTSTPELWYSVDGRAHISSETETVDFTKLVFERDKNMSNYYQLLELEEEFYDLELKLEDERPYFPKNVTTMEEWAQATKPDLRNRFEKNIINAILILIGIIGIVSSFAIAVVVAITHEELAEISQVIGAISCVLFGFNCFFLLRLLMQWLSEKRAMKIALEPESSKYRSALENMYNNLVERIRVYDETKARMSEIILIAHSLLE